MSPLSPQHPLMISFFIQDNARFFFFDISGWPQSGPYIPVSDASPALPPWQTQYLILKMLFLCTCLQIEFPANLVKSPT